MRRLRRAGVLTHVVVDRRAVEQAVGDAFHVAQRLVASLRLRVQFQRALVVAVVLQQDRRVQRAGRHIPVCAELLEARHRLTVVQPRVLVQPHRPVDQPCVGDASGDAERDSRLARSRECLRGRLQGLGHTRRARDAPRLRRCSTRRCRAAGSRVARLRGRAAPSGARRLSRLKCGQGAPEYTRIAR
jgi:hypothetical protein